MADPTNEPRRPLEDLRVERARLALIDYQGTDLGGMTVDGMASWLGRFSVLLENLLEHVDQAATPAVPPTDRIHGQRLAHALLGNLLDQCVRDDLPALRWDIGTTGMLQGWCVDPDRVRRRYAFRAWTDALGLGVWPETTLANGATRLQAVREDVAGVDVVVIADVRQEGRS